MAFSTQRSVSDGSLVSLALSIEYFDRTEITVFFDGIIAPAPSALWAWLGTTDKTINFTPAVPNGVEVMFARNTALTAPRHQYTLGAQFIAETLDDNFTQALRIVQEAKEGQGLTDVFNDLDLHGNRVRNVALAIDDVDIVTLGQYRADALGAYASSQAALAYLTQMLALPGDYVLLPSGNGVTDDYPLLSAALVAAAGRDILLESGKVYRIDSPLVYSGNVSIRSTGAAPAVILHNGQAFNPCTFSGSLVSTKVLAATQQMHNFGWDLVDTVGILPGMLFEVMSSASWYHDPRPESTDARKSELHRVAYVVGNTVYSADPSNDGYALPSEAVTLTFYNPISVRIDNVTVRGVLPSPQVDAARVAGVSVKYALEPQLTRVNVENCAAVGIRLISCYGGTVDGGHTYGANDYYTGYGVQVSGCANTLVQKRLFWQCRRGVDVSGAHIISRHTLIEACTNHGGGINSEGTQYGWTDAGATGAPQYGFGSHGPADHTIYRGNTASRMFNFIVVRGRNELVENNTFIGRTRDGAITLIYGENLRVVGNAATFGAGALAYGTVTEGGGNVHTRRCDTFVNVGATYQGGYLVIESNDCEVQAEFVHFDSGAVKDNVTIARNKVRFATSSSGDLCTLALNAGASATVNYWTVVDNDFRRVGGTGAVSTFSGLVIGTANRVVELGDVVDGVWTPSAVGVSNVGSISTDTSMFFRVGGTVHFAASIVVTPTAGGTVEFTLSLPVPRDDFSSTYSALGVIGSTTLNVSASGGLGALVGSALVTCRAYLSTVSATVLKIQGTYNLG